jgi:hypothetical protein
LLGAPASIPLEPDPDEGRRLLVDELAKAPYQEARPTLFDIIAKAIGDWIGSILDGAGSTGGGIGLALIVALVATLLVVAFLVFGRPRLERRRRATTALFGDDDTRTAEQMRLAARSAASRGDHDTAVLEMYRAIARALSDRTLVDIHPGTTATGFARAATGVFPEQSEALAAAARLFDSIRYLGGRADAADYERVAVLDSTLAGLTPRIPRLTSAGTP